MRELILHGELRGDDVPSEIPHWTQMTIIVPDTEPSQYHWYINSTDPFAFERHAYTVLDEILPNDGNANMMRFVHNVAAAENSERTIILLVMIFTYGFVGMLTLIGLTNVISTISTNIRSRSREFAVLRSVGMTSSGLRRMLNLESILCSAKSLIIGLPIGVLVSYLIYQSIMQSVAYSYQIPWISVTVSIIAIFVITWVTMHYSAARLSGGNIIETIRADSGM